MPVYMRDMSCGQDCSEGILGEQVAASDIPAERCVRCVAGLGLDLPNRKSGECGTRDKAGAQRVAGVAGSVGCNHGRSLLDDERDGFLRQPARAYIPLLCYRTEDRSFTDVGEREPAIECGNRAHAST